VPDGVVAGQSVARKMQCDNSRCMPDRSTLRWLVESQVDAATHQIDARRTRPPSGDAAKRAAAPDQVPDPASPALISNRTASWFAVQLDQPRDTARDVPSSP